MDAAEAVFLRSKVLVEKNQMSEAGRLLPLVYGEARVRLLLVMAERYTNHRPVDTAYLGNALPLRNACAGTERFCPLGPLAQ